MVTSVDPTRRWILIVYRINFAKMGGWNCGGSDLNYPKIGIEIAIINSKIGIAMARIS